MMVVAFHYKHFLLISTEAGFDYSHMPFAHLLLPVYIYGQNFVELFFSISGYVFFWLYSRAIASHHTGAKAFFIARFARLYPLYLAMLLTVALIQWLFTRHYGYSFIYENNGLIDFVLNLFMVHQWVPYPVMSFNGPGWSISVEVFLYTLFFLVCWFRRNGPVTAAALIIAGLVFKYLISGSSDFARGVPSFFLGGLIWYAVQYLNARAREVWRGRVVCALVWALPFLWLVSYARPLSADWAMTVIPEPADTWSWLLNTEVFIYLVLPATILFLGLLHARRPADWLPVKGIERLGWIGDISYSLYLIHFPLQITLMLFLARWPYEKRLAVLGSPLGFIAFMGVASGLAWLSFHYFEMPARRTLRRWMTKLLVRPKQPT